MSIKVVSNSAIINVMASAVFKAAKGLLHDYGELDQLQVSRKGLGDFVSSADKKSEQVLIQELSKTKPDYNFITEESGEITNSESDFYWVIDPLDGTQNFLHALPHFAIAVALMRGNTVLAAVTYDPIKDELFWAEKGKGAFLNKRKIRVSNRKEFDRCVVAMGWRPRDKEHARFIKMSKTQMFSEIGAIRQMGAATLDLAYVACGRIDAYIVDSGLRLWDMAGGILLVQEALGTVTETTYSKKMLETGSVLVANQEIHQPLHNLLNTD